LKIVAENRDSLFSSLKNSKHGSGLNETDRPFNYLFKRYIEHCGAKHSLKCKEQWPASAEVCALRTFQIITFTKI